MLDDSKKDHVAAVDRRRFPRYSVAASAEATDVTSQTRINARISDLSREGCYVDTISPFVVDTDVYIQIAKDKALFSARARVLYSSVGMGMGLIFTAIEPADISILEKWIAELNGDRSHAKAYQSPVKNQGSESPLNEVRDVLHEIVTTLVRRRILNDAEGEAMLKKLSISVAPSKLTSC